MCEKCENRHREHHGTHIKVASLGQMPSQITIYKIEDFIKKTPTGEVSLEKSIKTFQTLARAAENYPDHNALLDLREVEGYLTFDEVGVVIDEFTQQMSIFKNKIAILVPVDDKRMARAIYGQSRLTAKGFQAQVFVDYEDAIEWLSDVTQIEV